MGGQNRTGNDGMDSGRGIIGGRKRFGGVGGTGDFEIFCRQIPMNMPLSIYLTAIMLSS